jgi:hypothetical protein
MVPRGLGSPGASLAAVGSAAAGGSAGSDFRFFGAIGKRARVLRLSLRRWRLGFPDTGGSEREEESTEDGGGVNM